MRGAIDDIVARETEDHRTSINRPSRNEEDFAARHHLHVQAGTYNACPFLHDRGRIEFRAEPKNGLDVRVGHRVGVRLRRASKVEALNRFGHEYAIAQTRSKYPRLRSGSQPITHDK